MRAFIAVEVSKEITSRLFTIQRELPSGLALVKPEAMHLTMKFLGEIDEAKAKEVSKSLDSLIFSPLALTCRSLGVFPSRNFPRVLWAGIESPGLIGLHSKLDQKLAGLGFQKEDFTPHLTIARAKEKVELESVLEKHSGELFGECLVHSLYLKKSTLTQNGPIYENVHFVSVRI
jgi:RNA 2',3'-cyclic 3'-phosphodiesterase